MNLATLTARGEALQEALGREYYLAAAGLKRTPAFQAIYDRYASLLSDEALEAARASGSRALLEWIVDVRVGRLVAPFEERQLVWEQEAVLEVNGRSIPYLRAPIELTNSADRAFRIGLDAARVAKAAELEVSRRERFGLEHGAFAALGFPDYVGGVAALSGIDLEAMRRAATGFLDATRDMYLDALKRLARRAVGVPLGDLVRSDAGWVFRASRFDDAFPGGALLAVAARQMRELGIGARQEGRVRFDTDEREGKQPRAFCAPVRVPDEVYLVLRPRGGHQDYRVFWHELGHAMHFASVNRDLPFAARWLGDHSVTEGFAMLWDHMTLSVEWLARYTSLGRRQRAELGYELAVNELYLARRYAAKLCYELELHRSGLNGMGGRYAALLTEATGFRYPDGDHLHDVDPGLYAARYLRAWQLEAALAAWLTELFDADWFRNPAAGEAVQEWLGWGQRQPADQLAREVCGVELSFERVARRFATVLDS